MNDDKADFNIRFRLITIFLTGILLLFLASCEQKINIHVDRRWQNEKIAKIDDITGLSSFDLDLDDRVHAVFSAESGIYYAKPSQGKWDLVEINYPHKILKKYSNIKLKTDTYGKVHLILDTVDNGGVQELIYGQYHQGKWNFSTIAKEGYGGAISLDRNESPVVVYRVGELVMMATVEGNSWKREELTSGLGGQKEDAVNPLAISIGTNSNPVVVVADQKNNRVAGIRKSSGRWLSSDVVNEDGIRASKLSLNSVSDKMAFVSFEIYDGGDVGYGCWDGSKWSFERIGPSGAIVPGISSDENGIPSITYFTYGFRELVFSRLEKDEWIDEKVEKRAGGRLFSQRPVNIELKFDSRNRPVIVYADPGLGELVLYRKTRR